MNELLSQTTDLDALRQEAKLLQRGFIAGDVKARSWVNLYLSGKKTDQLRRADFLFIVARERGFSSWPALKMAAETQGLDRAEKVQRLKVALYSGNNALVQVLLDQVPDLAKGLLGLEVALYDVQAVRAALDKDPTLAVKMMGPRSPILHLAFSKWHQARPDLRDDMLEIARLLLAHGADVNDGEPVGPDGHKLSALYGAIGHANNMVLGQFLLDHGANPNDGESLYHAIELGHHDGLRMLLKAGADPKDTNALPRAMDFHDHDAVALLLEHGADVNVFHDAAIGRERPYTVPALHQAGRRYCDARMVKLLLEAGADASYLWQGTSAYATARVYGNGEMVRVFDAQNLIHPLSPQETILAAAADGRDIDKYLDPDQLSPLFATILHDLCAMPDRLEHIRRLIEAGMPWDGVDGMGMSPVMMAGWNGLPDIVKYLLAQKPDLSRVNKYGGTLMGTILNGAHNAPDRDQRDHIACLQLALEEGMVLSRKDMAYITREDMRSFVEDWANNHPSQVV